MKNLFKYLLLIILCSCSTFSRDQEIKNEIKLYSYQDASGIYFYKRYIKRKKNKLIIKNVIFSNGNEHLPLEKTITVSTFVYNKNVTRLRPDVSQFSVWFEKEKYFVQHKTDLKSKSLLSLSKEKSQSKKKSTAFPSADSFCYFNQLPECFLVLGALDLGLGKSKKFMLLWEASPYHNQQYSGFNENIFYNALVRREEDRKGLKRFSVEVNGQLLFIEFTKENEFTSIFWIAQGITIQKIRG